MKFQMITKPGVPNVNGITYSEECWNNFLKNNNTELSKIPITDIDYNTIANVDKSNIPDIPPQNLLGFLSKFEDNSVFFDPIIDANIEKRLKQYEVEGRKAFMRYVGDVDTIDGEKVITNIDKIISIDIEPEELAK